MAQEMTAVMINDTPLFIKEYNGKRVVTLKDIDTVHGKSEGTARKRFNDHRDRFIEGEDYFVRNADEAKIEFGVVAPNGLILMAQSGYLMLVKVFNDDLSWQVQRELVNGYFYAVETKKKATKPQKAPLSDDELAMKKVEMLTRMANSKNVNKQAAAEMIASAYELLTGEKFTQKTYESLCGWENEDYTEAFLKLKDTISKNLFKFQNGKWGKIDGFMVYFIKTEFDKVCKKMDIDPKPFLRWLDDKDAIVRDKQGQYTKVAHISDKGSVRCVVLKINFSDNE